MRSTDRMILAVVVSGLLAMFTIRSLTSDVSYLTLGGLGIVLLGVVTAGLRRAHMGSGATLLVQLFLVAGYVLVLSAGMPSSGEPWYAHYVALWSDGIDHMQTQAAPMVPNDGVTIIFVTVAMMITVLTDLLVGGLGRPMWGLAPPLTLFLVPAVGLGADTGLLSFVCVAVGYLGILVAEGLNTTARWTRGLSRDSADGQGAAAPVVWRAAGLIGAPALVLTLLLGAILPTWSLPGFGFGAGSGAGGQLQLTDPTLDLRRNLNQADDRTVIEYTTDQPGGLYLRMASLPELNDSGWHNIAMRLTEGNTLPSVPGLGSEPSQRRRTEITVTGGFTSQYLPLPYAPRSFQAEGDWAYDTNSLVVIANGGGRDRNDAIRNLSYSVESVDIAPDPSALSGALAGTPTDDDVTGEVPGNLPDALKTLTEDVISDANATSAVDKAAAIQAYLRSSAFTYSTERLPGTGFQALENFLLRDRTGYCEQFAGAMAMMARVAGIPSRVAVGFLPGTRDGDTWRVSIRDMHAWPELYFAGLGWVRFEPTPATVTGTAPDWTLGGDNQPTTAPSEQPSEQPSAAAPSASSAPSAGPAEAPTATDAGTGFSWRTVLAALGALVLLLVLAAPATIRVRRRTSRMAEVGEPAERVEAAWAEIRDTVLDHGGDWPAGSPRAIGAEVGGRLDGTESAGMTRVATLVERSRYARTLELDPELDLNATTDGIRRGIAAPQSWWRRALAAVFPRSLLRR